MNKTKVDANVLLLFKFLQYIAKTGIQKGERDRILFFVISQPQPKLML